MGGADIPTMDKVNINPATQGKDGTYGINNNIQGGEQLLASLQQRMNQGIDPNTLNQWRNYGQGAIGANFKSGMDTMNNSNPNATLSGKAGMMDKLYQGRGQQLAGLENNISQSDQEAKMKNYWSSAGAIPGLSQMAYGIGAGKFGQDMQRQFGQAQMNNQSMTNQYNMEQQGQFDWGGLLGSLFGIGGQLGSAAILKP